MGFATVRSASSAQLRIITDSAYSAVCGAPHTAEFERDMIRSRVNAGLARARARGVRLGRPTASRKVETAVRAHLAAGDGVLKAARAAGCGTSVAQRIKAEMTMAESDIRP